MLARYAATPERWLELFDLTAVPGPAWPWPHPGETAPPPARDQVTFVTSRGRRVAAVVSVAAAEQAAGTDGQADDDAGTATMYAVNLAMLEDRGGTPGLTPAELFEDYANDLLRELGGSPDRALAAARAVAAGSIGKVGYPMLWRQAALAVELCQRAAEITGQVLPGSYRPGSRAAGRTTRGGQL